MGVMTQQKVKKKTNTAGLDPQHLKMEVAD